MKWMKEIRKNKKMKKRAGSHGIITVFVTLMMVPVVAITGVMVDVARLNLYSSQAVMAADTYGDAVLSEFDNLLKELYGLFSVTQNKEGLEAIEKLSETITYSFHPTGDGKNLSGFMPYKDADVKLSYEKVDGASLFNHNVLMTQISDFMKYRIVEEVLEDQGVLGSLNEFDNMDADMEAIKTRTEISDSSQEALGKIQDYYNVLKQLAAYPVYLDGLTNSFNRYSAKLREVVSTDEYEKYIYYKEHQSEIEDALEEFGGNADEEDQDQEENTEETAEENNESEEDPGLADRVALYDAYKDFDVEEYVDDLEQELLAYEKPLTDYSGSVIDFDNAGSVIKDLGKQARELEKTLESIEEQVESLKIQLELCSEDIKEGIKKEIKDLEKISSLSGEFLETYKLIENINHDTEKNTNNKQDFKREADLLTEVRKNILTGNVQYRDDYWKKQIILQWYDFMDDKSQFFRELQKFCEGNGDGNGDKNAGEREIKRANNIQESAEKKLDIDEQTTARDIPAGIASQLGSGQSTGEVPGFKDYLSGGLSLKNLSAGGEHALDKFLVTSYDFGMFSSRVSGVKPPDQNDSSAVSANNSYRDVSLTGITMSPDVNYLYGAELEYLLGGYRDSVSNLNKSRNIICGVRETMNFVSSYKIPEVNEAISAVAEAAGSAVAASVVGAPAAPLVTVAVSGALRLAFASVETVADWSELKERDSVTFLKKDLDELSAKEELEDLLGIEISSSSSEERLGLSYEDYMFVLLCIFTDSNTLLSRTSDLITLNVNQAKNKGKEWTSLDFKMQDTVTAVKSTCKVKADFVVVPDNIAELFYSGTSTETQIKWLENHYFGYSVIRGY